ncbi:MAG TPA: heavy metal-associated domain-containing protein [Nitrososphaeraceae archaeon]|nr:heavy metal-associated domain-containing protein [Nitrososphaeraceae archaeon]
MEKDDVQAVVTKSLIDTMTKTEKVLFRVVGMYCVSCKSIVEKQLKKEQAVKKIDIDYLTDRIIVKFDPSLITTEEIKDRLEKSGYKFVRILR